MRIKLIFFRQVEMLYRSNFFAFIPGGPGVADNVVLGYDFSKDAICMDSAFVGKVLSVRLRRDKMVVVRNKQISVFSFPGVPQLLHTIDTRGNPKGLCELSPLATSQRVILAHPGQKVGSVIILDLSSTKGQTSHSITINAHQSELECIALNQSGTMLATASQKGTLIRVFDTAKSSVQLHEFRRGTDPATLYCINFSPDDRYLCCSSDKGTVHIFAMLNTTLNRRSTFAPLSVMSLVSYAESQWALTSFKVTAECACICAFGPQVDRGQVVYAVCVDGTFHKYIFSETTQKATPDSFDIFFDVCPHDKQEQWTT
ncbi:WD repeat domain phosphoinositide-interacting protein 4-like [Tropilaelaps mercedesae]|uniref:WD repeat domain phosphoinositide-interacting protein 4-like n=1 Tax=Tropilaelaps mercedesae TaxID=418985 RepID=A0A1V9XVR0_9ACAR|nr:WD repeat domain phosphoinositide-interacting protein 4-like [Tropilaelaps mercedesae]